MPNHPETIIYFVPSPLFQYYVHHIYYFTSITSLILRFTQEFGVSICICEHVLVWMDQSYAKPNCENCLRTYIIIQEWGKVVLSYRILCICLGWTSNFNNTNICFTITYNVTPYYTFVRSFAYPFMEKHYTSFTKKNNIHTENLNLWKDFFLLPKFHSPEWWIRVTNCNFANAIVDICVMFEVDGRKFIFNKEKSIKIFVL